MNAKEMKFLERIQTKLQCNEAKCGEHFTLTISDNQLEHLVEAKQEYSGTCSKCHNSIKIKGNELDMFKRTMGDPKIVIKKSTFDNLFEIKK